MLYWSIYGAFYAVLAGVICLILFLFLGRNKTLCDQSIARLTAKVWFECKLLFLFPGLLLPFSGIYTRRLDGIIYLLASFWLAYLFVNDCRYTPRPWAHSALAALADTWRRSGQGLPFRRKLLRRGVLAFAGTLPLAALAGLTLLGLFHFSLSWGLDLFHLVLPFLCACGIALLLLIPLGWQIKGTLDFAQDVEALTRCIAALRAGDLGAAPALPGDSDLCAAAADLAAVREGMDAALAERVKSERTKVELIANVSHDLKTPLTSVISYVELLKEEEGLPDHVRDYIRILDEKSHRLSGMVRDVFEISKAASGTMPVKSGQLNFGKLLDQTLADMAEAIEESGLVFKVDRPQTPVYIDSDGDRLYRVFQNLFQNALQYSLPGSRVYVTLRARDGRAAARVQNTSRDELPPGVDLTQRFVRGDPSRTDSGSGLGLAIASSFTYACGGAFQVATEADLFTAEVSFPTVKVDT